MQQRSSILLLLAASALIAGCGGSSSSSKSSSSSASATSSSSATSGGGLDVKSTEYRFAPASLSAKAGKVKLTLDNQGKIPHELVLLKTNAPAGKLPTKGGRASESASVGEISETDGGKSVTKSFDLKPGKYVYVCNIPGHYKDGMRGLLTVQ